MDAFISNEEKKHIVTSLRSQVPATKFLILKKIGEMTRSEPEKIRGLSSSDSHTFGDMMSIITYLKDNDFDETIRREAGITLEKIQSIMGPKSAIPMNCPQCNELIDIGWNHCASCGAILKEQHYQAKKCMGCGGYIKDSWSFCVHCRKELKPVKKISRCPNCKRPMARSWFSCPYCGAKLKKA